VDLGLEEPLPPPAVLGLGAGLDEELDLDVGLEEPLPPPEVLGLGVGFGFGLDGELDDEPPPPPPPPPEPKTICGPNNLFRNIYNIRLLRVM
jgi:hypothetical protein